MEMNGQLHVPAALSLGTHWLEGWVGSRGGLEAVAKRRVSCPCSESRIVQWYSAACSGGSSPGRGWEFFSSPPPPDRLWGPRIFLYNGY